MYDRGPVFTVSTRRTTPDLRKVLLIVVLAAVATAVAFALPPLTRPPSYYDFADRRQMFGIHNFMDVMSGALWLVVGVIGLVFIARSPAGAPSGPFADQWDRAQFAVLFFGVMTIAIGSGYFHLAPTVATLVWDRLPMSITFMSLFGIVIGDRIDRRAGRMLFAPLLALGIGSVVYWRYTEALGTGDERLYGLVQFFPMLALPIILLLFPARHGTRDLFTVVGWYGLAKLFELTDKPVFAATSGVVSGHTLKHVCGGIATVWLLRMMKTRGRWTGPM